MIQKSISSWIKSNRTWLIRRSRNLFIKAPALLALVLFAFVQTTNENSAIVNKIDGYYIFIESKPLKEYEVLGDIKSPGVVWNGRPAEMMNVMMKRLKKDYPKADAILFESHKLEQAKAIQFK